MPGEPPISSTRWIESFETYLLALGLGDVSVARKKAPLQHCLGAEGQLVLGTLGNITALTMTQLWNLLEHTSQLHKVLFYGDFCSVSDTNF